ncbi:hypothetical protein HF521_015582 [Silurus meridionalis]|uniref:PH domain-containing protein n=1 Tax=Silurus meridionalis TaxID=175797 RepID=A0A8T0A5R4_SILME|nr:hypothetical protein HF521_015582 [Silurus meridionalis]
MLTEYPSIQRKEDLTQTRFRLLYSNLHCTNMDLEEQDVPLVIERKSKDNSQDEEQEGGWKIMESIQESNSNVQKPIKQEGFLLKRRKRPMKGWHKRYFLLERGILMYGKTLADLKKGKVRGCIDIGLSVMSIKKKNMCIDLDAEDSIYHLKVKSLDQFDKWVSQLRNHRIFRQNEIVMDSQEHHLHSDTSSLRRQAVLSKQSSALLRTVGYRAQKT